jgi:hypothetical protein
MIAIPHAPALHAIVNVPANDPPPAPGPCQSPGCDGLPTSAGFGDLVLCDDCWGRFFADEDEEDDDQRVPGCTCFDCL